MEISSKASTFSPRKSGVGVSVTWLKADSGENVDLKC